MPSAKDVPEPWLAFLLDIDALVDEEVNLHCLGGFVVAEVFGLGRATADFDVLSIAPANVGKQVLQAAGRGGSLHRKHKVYLDHVSVTHVPEDYEERLRPIFRERFKRLRLFALDPYDLALSKLERNSAKDRADVFHIARAVPLDLKILRDRYERELRWQMGIPEREDQTFNLWIEAIEEERSTRR
jgi:hypothetical protein